MHLDRSSDIDRIRFGESILDGKREINGAPAHCIRPSKIAIDVLTQTWSKPCLALRSFFTPRQLRRTAGLARPGLGLAGVGLAEPGPAGPGLAAPALAALYQTGHRLAKPPARRQTGECYV